MSKPWTFRNLLRRPSHQFITLRGNEKLCGTLVFSFVRSEKFKFAVVDYLAVNIFRKGLGTKIMEAFESEVKELGFDEVIIQSEKSLEVQSFYQKLGYSRMNTTKGIRYSKDKKKFLRYSGVVIYWKKLQT